MTDHRNWRWPLLLGAGVLCGCAHFQPRPLSPAASAATFEARTLTNEGLRTFLTENHVPPPASSAAWDLKALTLVALYYQPALAVARGQLLAAQVAQITAGQRPNPSISLAPAHDAVPGTPSPWIVPLALDWPIETAGKRGYRIAEARARASAARWRLIGAVWQVRGRVRSALLDIYAARKRDSLWVRQVSTERQVVRLLQGQFAAGSVPSYIVARARVALNTAALAQQVASGEVRQARVRLAGALSVPPRALRGVRFSCRAFSEFPLHLTQPQVRRRALSSRADVLAALADYAASQSALQLQIAKQYPDIQLGPGYAWNAQLADDSSWSLGLDLTLPILNHNLGPIAEAKARRRLAAARFLSVQANALDEIDSALAAYESARQRVATATSLMVNLQQQFASVRARVQAGELQPVDRFNAEVAFEGGAQDQLQARIAAQRALGLLEQAVQSPLTLAPATLRAAQQPTFRHPDPINQ